MKRISIIAILMMTGAIVLTLSAVHFSAQAQTEEEPPVSADEESAEAVPEDTVKADPEVIAYYFHTTYRCASCKKIEAYSAEAIETGFAEELENGTLKFESINIDEPDNEHFAKDYQLYTKSVIVCDMEDGKQTEWKNLTKVWELIRDKDEFVKYVQDEISAYLKEG